MCETTTSDEQLMKRSAQGDRGSFESLVRRHARPLMTLINRCTGQHHRSEDIFQEVLFACWAKRAQYQFPRAFKPWLYRIAINQCRQVFRKRDLTVSNQETPMDAHQQTQAISPEKQSLQIETAAIVKKAVQRLPEQQRAVVVLRIWNQMSYREIAQAIDSTESTVRSYMFHALNSLRQSLHSHGL